MKPFAADIRHWPTLAALRAHLWRHDPSVCAWVKGITLHHTIKPLPSDWRGLPSVENLRTYYRDSVPWTDAQGKARKGWTAGPHLFLAQGTPDPRNDGFFQLTPLNLPGIHAASFNATHWGIEICGRFDGAPWPAPLEELVIGGLVASLQWLGLPASSINGHRDDPKTTKSCPGWAINLDQVRERVAGLLANDLTFIARPRISREQFAQVLARALSPAAAEAGAMYDACVARGVDPALLLAFFHHESKFGHAGLCFTFDLKNPGNVRTPMNAGRGTPLNILGRGPFFQFRTWADGAADWAERMADRYARTLGLPSIRSALPVYAPSSDNNRPDVYGTAVLNKVRQWQQEAR